MGNDLGYKSRLLVQSQIGLDHNQDAAPDEKCLASGREKSRV